jgi:hypothetical protein
VQRGDAPFFMRWQNRRQAAAQQRMAPVALAAQQNLKALDPVLGSHGAISAYYCWASSVVFTHAVLKHGLLFGAIVHALHRLEVLAIASVISLR